MATNAQKIQKVRQNFRQRLTKHKATIWVSFFILLSGFSIIVFLGYKIIGIADSTGEAGKNQLEASKWVFNALIPLFAAWIGAVIAYYFGKDNFEAGAAQALGLTREKLTELRVENFMHNLKTMVSVKLSEEEYKTKGLKELVDLYNTIDKDRIPILSPTSEPKFIIHRDAIQSFLNSKPEDERANLTLQDILDAHPKKYRHDKQDGFITMSGSDSVGHALKVMESVGCRDVFVTRNGKADTAVLGWVTDSLAERVVNV